MTWLLLVAVLTQRPGQPEIRVPELEGRVHELINVERKNAKINPLEIDDRLARIARAHSEDMAKRNFFSHVSPEGKDATARAKVSGYDCRKISFDYSAEGLGENIYQGNLYSSVQTRGTQRTYNWNSAEVIASESVRAWMQSDVHRKNILQKNYTLTGIGIAIAADDKVYVTQVFC
jgi:uncharacterized protein YkwD